MTIGRVVALRNAGTQWATFGANRHKAGQVDGDWRNRCIEDHGDVRGIKYSVGIGEAKNEIHDGLRDLDYQGPDQRAEHYERFVDRPECIAMTRYRNGTPESRRMARKLVSECRGRLAHLASCIRDFPPSLDCTLLRTIIHS